MDIVDNPSEDRYELIDGDARVGEMDYQRMPSGVLRIIHTEVDADHRAGGTASHFVQTVLDALRAEGTSIRPDCPYVAHWLTEHPDYADLVAH